jgi:predicted RNA binding protein YcfA (HicA-like mRNA interferase family)
MNKQVQQLIKQAEQQGWSVTKTNNSHYCWKAPNGKMFYSAGTPSDNRAIKNIESDLRNSGFIILKKKGKRNKK